MTTETTSTLESNLERLSNIPKEVIKMFPWNHMHPADLLRNFEKNGLSYLQDLARPNYSIIQFKPLIEEDPKSIYFKIKNNNQNDLEYVKMEVGSKEFLNRAIADVYIESSGSNLCGFDYVEEKHTISSLGINLLPFGNVISFIDVECCSGIFDKIIQGFNLPGYKDPFSKEFQRSLSKKVLERSGIILPNVNKIGIELPFSQGYRFHVVPITSS